MEMVVEKSQNVLKKGWFSGESNLELSFEIKVYLDEIDHKLIEEYYDPEINLEAAFKVICEDNTEKLDHLLSLIKDKSKLNLSEFCINATSSDGIKEIGLLDLIISTCENCLKTELGKLKKYSEWVGQKSTII